MIINSYPVTRKIFSHVINITESCITFWRNHMTQIFPAQIICNINPVDFRLVHCSLHQIIHKLILSPVITVSEWFEIFLNEPICIQYVFRTVLNMIYVHSNCVNLNTLSLYFKKEVYELGHMILC
jgi:hypothetical protein